MSCSSDMHRSVFEKKAADKEAGGGLSVVQYQPQAAV